MYSRLLLEVVASCLHICLLLLKLSNSKISNSLFMKITNITLLILCTLPWLASFRTFSVSLNKTSLQRSKSLPLNFFNTTVNELPSTTSPYSDDEDKPYNLCTDENSKKWTKKDLDEEHDAISQQIASQYKRLAKECEGLKKENNFLKKTLQNSINFRSNSTPDRGYVAPYLPQTWKNNLTDLGISSVPTDPNQNSKPPLPHRSNSTLKKRKRKQPGNSIKLSSSSAPTRSKQNSKPPPPPRSNSMPNTKNAKHYSSQTWQNNLTNLNQNFNSLPPHRSNSRLQTRTRNRKQHSSSTMTLTSFAWRVATNV